MREEINKADLQKFNRDGVIFSLLLVLTMVTVVPLAVFLGYYGLMITGILFCISMYFAIKIEKFKKDNDIQTFKEIVSFMEGKRLDEIEKVQEYGKRPYQTILCVLVCSIITFVVCMIFVWLLKSYIF